VHAAQALGPEAKVDDSKNLPDLLWDRLSGGDPQSDGEPWDVLHFVGHAGPDRTPGAGEGGIVLWCEDRRGEYQAIVPNKLREWLQKLARDGKVPKAVILEACSTAGERSDLVRTLLEGGVGTVVGMQWPVKDEAATAFGDGFYTTLARRGQVDHAVSVGRSRMVGKLRPGERDWAAPVLVMQMEDGHIFRRE
jgi:hypothetical protein